MEARKLKHSLGTSIFSWILVFGSTPFGLIRYLMTILPLLDLEVEPKGNAATAIMMLLGVFIWALIYATRTVSELYQELNITSAALRTPGLTVLPIIFGGNLFCIIAMSGSEAEGKFVAFLMLIGTYIWVAMIAGLKIALSFGFGEKLNAKIDQLCQQSK